ncbi:hypothetical protein A2W16_03875 [Candidatus Amesbacteria bacterium RBG_16_48_31]|nr:MAG: hypothetical protein A2W16_03875 [Candidatus Amesbacteria bacterium RBG_16_48_31]
MGWIDAHCHLQDEGFEIEIEKVVGRAREAGVKAMVCAGYDLESSQRAIELAERYPEIWATVGIHPDEIQNSNDKFTNQPLREQIQIISKLTKHQKVVAVGEAGLDFRADTTLEEKQRQIELFRFNIALAVEARLPIVVHCRNAFDDAFRVLSTKYKVLRGIQMHCWTGSWEWAEKFLGLGCYMGFGGMVTYRKNEELREVVRLMPEERLLLETDAPYLAPQAMRGSKNEPANLIETAKTIAREREMGLDKLEKITTQNAVKLFRRMQI